MSASGRLTRFGEFAQWNWWKVLFRSIENCSLCCLCCWARCWMLQHMDNMEASCIFYVNVCTFTALEQSKICLLTVYKTGFVKPIIHHDWIVSVSFRYYRRDYLRPTSADIFSIEQWRIDIWQSCDFGCRSPRFIPGNNPTTSDRLIANRETVVNPCNLHSYTPGFMLSISYKLAATYSILTWRSLYIPQDFPLGFLIIFLFYSTLANDAYTNTSARRRRIRSKPIDVSFIQYVTAWHTARLQTPGSPARHCQWSHQNYHPGCTFKNRP